MSKSPDRTASEFSPSTDPSVELEPTAMAHGGEAVARVDGKAWFVAGAMPGERVEAQPLSVKKRFTKAKTIQVLEASPDRVEPPCPHFAACGGCQWQYADYAAQLEWKQEIIASQLRHLGDVVDVHVLPAVSGRSEYAYRNRMDFRVEEGKPALFKAKSKQLVPLDVCLLLNEGLRDLFDNLGDLTGVRSITIRHSEANGDRMVILDGEVPAQAERWRSNVVTRRGRQRDVAMGSLHFTEAVAGITLRITADAFFQNNTSAAEQLVYAVDRALEPQSSDRLLDGYSGGGLFAATVGTKADFVVAVESERRALGDLRANLAGALPGRHLIVDERFEGLRGERCDLAVVDPPRSGLESAGVAAVVGAAPRTVAYVSCDPAALARDARMLDRHGYVLEWVQPVDLFPQTFHIESVARFRRE